MKQLQDYAHLYIGQEAIADGNRFTIHGFLESPRGHIAFDGNSGRDGHPEGWWIENCDFKLLLRPLSDMTEEEMRAIIQIIHCSIFNSEMLFKSLDMVRNEANEVGGISYDADDKRISCTIEIDKGVEFYYDGRQMNVNQFTSILYLLKQGFDIFGLIE